MSEASQNQTPYGNNLYIPVSNGSKLGFKLTDFELVKTIGTYCCN